MTVRDLITAIIASEGGDAYTDDPADKGGPTKYGITQKALTDWRRVPATPEDVQLLTEGEARAIYEHRYIIEPGFSLIGSEALRGVLVDFGVNSGPRNAVRALQAVLGVTVDGIIGPQTVQAAALKDGRRLGILVLAQRGRFIGRWLERDHSQAKYAAGILNRVMSQVEELA